MLISGISTFFHDSAAALMVDGEIIVAAQEERFTRRKDEPGFAPRSLRSFQVAPPLRIKEKLLTPDPDRNGTGPLARGVVLADGSFDLAQGPDQGAIAGQQHRRVRRSSGCPCGLRGCAGLARHRLRQGPRHLRSVWRLDCQAPGCA